MRLFCPAIICNKNLQQIAVLCTNKTSPDQGGVQWSQVNKTSATMDQLTLLQTTPISTIPDCLVSGYVDGLARVGRVLIDPAAVRAIIFIPIDISEDGTIPLKNNTGRIVPKARPRVTRWGSHIPEAYRKSRDRVARQSYEQTKVRGLEHYALHIIFGPGQGQGDGDNREGTVLDALVEAKVLAGDTDTMNPVASRQTDLALDGTYIILEDLGMPLKKGPEAKTKAGIAENIRILINEGRPQDQAIAIAYRLAGKPQPTDKKQNPDTRKGGKGKTPKKK